MAAAGISTETQAPVASTDIVRNVMLTDAVRKALARIEHGISSRAIRDLREPGRHYVAVIQITRVKQNAWGAYGASKSDCVRASR